MLKMSFNPRAQILLQLGEQLIKNENVAILELVKNAYDADANKVIVNMQSVEEKDDGYIDHTEDLGDFIESTVFNEKRLLNYLFDYNSYVSTGNDNVDEEVETPDFGSSWDFDKGN